MPEFAERVIALDPGQRTGYAVGEMEEDYFRLVESGVLPQQLMAVKLAEWQGVRGPKGGPLVVPRFNVITWESWRPRPKNGSMEWIKGDRLLSAQHVGQIRFIGILSGARLLEQEPRDKTRFLASLPRQLRELDRVSNEQHDQDARWHLWGYFFDNWFTTRVDPEDTVFE